MTDDAYTPEQVAAITDYVDIEAPPVQAAAYFIFGTNQTIPIDLVLDRYHDGLAPFIIATGGVNRHNGVIEGQEFRRRLIDGGVNESVVRCEDRSANTWQNVEFALPYLREALGSGLAITAVSKWYHRRTIHCLRTLLPEIEVIYAVTFDPIYSGVPVTRTNWVSHPGGTRRVIREWDEVRRRVSDGSYKELNLINGAWR
jgi:uncharacterized SAM-binding protein YcdF (DUF218 family)